MNIHKAKTTLSALLAAVEDEGEVVLICRNGRPVAELRAVPVKKNPFMQDEELMQVEFHEDPAASLDPWDWPDA